MELKSNLAKELFDKVIIPIQNKTKTLPITNNLTEQSIIQPTNNILNKDEEKKALEKLISSIQENPTVLPPVPDTKSIRLLDNADITEPIMESVPATVESIQPPGPPSIKQCLAEKKDIDLEQDCDTETKKAKRSSLFRYHPDKNRDCKEYAETKFKELTNKCERYIPPATPPPTTEQPAPQPPTTEQPTPKPSTTEQPTPQPSTTEQPTPQPSTIEQPTPQPSTIEQPVEVVRDVPKDTKIVEQLVQALLTVLKKPEVLKEKYTELVSTTEKPEEIKDIASCDINETCEEQPLKPLVNVLSTILSKSHPAAGEGDTIVDESSEEFKSRFNLPKMPSIDISGKFSWIKQALSVLFATIGGLFTFEPVQDTDPYELREDKKNQGYIYVGKMFMKPEEPNTKAKSVKYISYHPENKDFFIDEQKEV